MLAVPPYDRRRTCMRPPSSSQTVIFRYFPRRNGLGIHVPRPDGRPRRIRSGFGQAKPFGAAFQLATADPARVFRCSAVRDRQLSGAPHASSDTGDAPGKRMSKRSALRFLSRPGKWADSLVDANRQPSSRKRVRFAFERLAVPLAQRVRAAIGNSGVNDRCRSATAARGAGHGARCAIWSIHVCASTCFA